MKRFRPRHTPVLFLLTICAAAFAFPAGASAFGYLGEFGTSGTGAGQMNFPEGVGVGPNGHVYVGEYTGNRVDEFTSTGTFIRMWGWGVQDGGSAFQICTSGCQAAISGTGDGQFNEIGDLDVHSVTGDVYALEDSGSRIQQFDATGNFIRKWGSAGSAEGQFGSAYGFGVGGSTILVADPNNNRVQQFTLDGSFLRMWGWGVDDGTAAFQVCTSGCQAGISGSGDGQFASPNEAAVAASGDVYVADGARIQQFSSTGTFIRKFGQVGTGDGDFSEILGLTTDAASNLWVMDSDNNRLQELTSTGGFLFKFGGTNGSGPGQFDSGYGIDFDCCGNLYEADLANNRIQKFGEAGLTATPTPTPTSSPDRTAPKQTVKAGKRQKTSSLSILLTLDESATVTVDGTVSVPGASKTVKFRALSKSVSANKTTKLKPKLSKKNGKQVKRPLKQGKKLTAKFKIKATDAAGNSSNSNLKIKLKR